MVAKFRRKLLEVKSHGPATVVHLYLPQWDYDPLAENPSEAEQQVETAIAEILRTVDQSEPFLVLNFREVSEFTGSSLTPIVKLAMDIKQRSGLLAVCHVPCEIQDIIATPRPDQLVWVFNSETEAVRSILLPSSA